MFIVACVFLHKTVKYIYASFSIISFCDYQGDQAPSWYFTVILSIFFVIPSALSGQKTFTQEGKASFYADKFEGKKTASGEIYKHSKATAAHKTLPFGTWVRVTNKTNNRSIMVKINDRGPFVKGRIIDLSKSAAKQLRYLKEGVTDVKIEVLIKVDNTSKNKNL